MAIRTLVTLCCLFALAPSTVSAVTVDEIVALTREGVSDAVIVALIERDRSVFALDPAQLIELQRAGVTDTVTVAMLRGGVSEQAGAAAPAPRQVATPMRAATVGYVVPVPVRRAGATAASAARGIFFSKPATGIFFAPPPVDCPSRPSTPPRR